MQADVLILGAGPAGATTALNLAPLHRVTLVDRYEAPPWRIGESLPGAAKRLLAAMDLWPKFLAANPLPRHVLRSAWGNATPVDRDALSDPDGHGWQIDRVAFERQLRAEAVARGARLIAPARVGAIDRVSDGWRVCLLSNGGGLVVNASVLIDATGRSSRRLVDFGARRHIADRLRCAWLRAPGNLLPAGVVYVEAEPDGWWYAANAPGSSILAFCTDADLPGALQKRSAADLISAARRLPLLAEPLGKASWASAQAGICTAHSATLEPAAGDAWLAVGDAAFASDPLASVGLFNALYFGLIGARAADRMLRGDALASADYADHVSRVRNAYLMNRESFYRLEGRWRDKAFWTRRRQTPADPSAVAVG